MKLNYLLYINRRRRFRFVSLVLGIVLFFFVITLVKETKISIRKYNDVMIPLRSSHQNQEEYIDKKGIHVVVGHYIGDDIPGKLKENLTDELLNSNGYSPQPGAGERGVPVRIPGFEIPRMQLLYKINSFNLLASDRIAVNRSLPDVRKKKCLEKTYPAEDQLPSTSVIIVFHNEAWSTLLRTVHSVIKRSSPKILKEIILVDDASQRTFLKEPLDEYMSKLSVPVKVLRTGIRSGLIRARLLGALKATGDVLTFLDAHCEVTTGWLVPLLSRIAEDRTRVVCPIIDIIDEDTFQYVRSFELYWGAFNWNLHFRWFTLGRNEVANRKKDVSHVYKTPAMAGGLFSIDRNYFYEIGTYDEAMEIWGGENLEMSFRVWMCGGSIEIVPCSHVGHVFRKSSPYTFPGEGGVGGTLYKNLARLALVWLDDWANFYFKINPEAARQKDKVDVKDRVLLRERLQCQDFEWYLQHVWDFNFFPSHDAFFGKIRHKGVGKCMERPQPSGSSTHPVGSLILNPCVIETYPSQTFIFKTNGYIMTDESVCLDAPDSGARNKSPTVRLSICSETDRQKWTYDPSNDQIKHLVTELCLSILHKSNPEAITLLPCKNNQWENTQKWLFDYEDWTSIT